jgi:thiol:disulfide interchange protein DsbC
MSGAAVAPVLQSAGCETPFARNAAITTKLRITGTPAILFSDNTKVPGYMTAAALEAKLKPNGK